MSMSSAPEDLAQGSEVIYSRYVRATMYSADAGVIFWSRFSSRSHSLRASAGIPDSSTFLRSSSISAWPSSLSPSSFFIAFICSRSKYSRLLLHLLLNLAAELQHFEFFGKLADEDFQTFPHTASLQQLLPQKRRERRQVSGNEVRQTARIFNVHGRCLKFVGELRGMGDDITE